MVPCLTVAADITEPRGRPSGFTAVLPNEYAFRVPAGQDIPGGRRPRQIGRPDTISGPARRRDRWRSGLPCGACSPVTVMTGMGVPSAPDHGGRPGRAPQRNLYSPGRPGGQEPLLGYAAPSRDNGGIACALSSCPFR